MLLRMSARRSRAEAGALAAALLTAVLAVAAVAVGPVYTSAVARSGLAHELAAAGSGASVRVVTTRRTADYADTDRAVTRALRDVQRPSGGEVRRSARSGSYDLPAEVARRAAAALGTTTDVITVFGFVEGLPDAATLTAGRWPAGTALEAVLPQPAADVLGVRVGDTLAVADRASATSRPARIVGTFTARDRLAALWGGDRLLTAGVAAGSFTTVGPLLVDPAAFRAQFADARTTAEWRVTPPPESVTLGDVGPLRDAVRTLPERLAALTGGAPPSVDSDLPQLLDDATGALTRARSGVLLPVVQLGVLAAVALLLIANLLSHRRADETALLVARGLAPRHVLGLAAGDAALLAAPAVLLGPLLAVVAVTALDDVGPLAATGLRLTPAVTTTTAVLALLTAAACTVTLAVPTWLHARRLTAPERRTRTRSRRALAGFAQRANADLALLLVAALGLWQLRRYGGSVVGDRIDPMLVLGPALGLVAGGVLLLRSVPVIARTADRVAAARKDVAGALAGWQLSRRTHRWSRPVLLLTLATATATFGAAYGATWSDAQHDRAAFATGADLRLSPRGVIAGLPTGAQRTAYAEVEGVDGVLPVHRVAGFVTGATGTAAVLAMQAEHVGGVLRLRDDLSDRPMAELAHRLRDTAGRLPGVPLPAGATRIEGVAALTPSDRVAPRTQTVSIVLRDAAGLLLQLPARPVPADGRAVPLRWDLRTGLGAAGPVEPPGPLTLVGVEVASATGTVFLGNAPQAARAAIETFVLRSLSAVVDDRPRPIVAPQQWTADIESTSRARTAPTVVVVPAPGVWVTARIGSGGGFGADATTVMLTAGDVVPAAGALPALATSRFLERTGSAVGDTVAVRIAGVDGVRIVGRLGGLPTTDESGLGGLVVDLATLGARTFAAQRTVPVADEVWLSTAPGADADEVVRTLTAAPYDTADVASLAAVTDSLVRDPIGAGLVGALVLSVVAALIFAVIGYAAAAATALRDRAVESALLRALGVPPGAVARGVVGEHAVVITVGVAAGVALGVALSWLVLPQSVPSAADVAALPAARVDIPWTTLGLLVAGVLVSLAVVVGALARRRVGASALAALEATT